MFTSLKNKIKEETGSDLSTGSIGAHHWTGNNRARTRSRYPSTVSVNSVDDGMAESQVHLTEQLNQLRGQCNELTTKVTELTGRLDTMQEEKSRMEKTNEILLETVKVAQTQKDIYCEEQEKIQNFQQTEIDKLKSLLSFREQEAIDRLTTLRQTQQHAENLTAELERIKKIEPLVESLQDELESLRHSSQLGKNNLTTTLAAVEEENCHLKMRLHIMEQTRLDTITTLDKEEKIQALVQERKLLGQHLEEAHLQLSDIKSSWSGQNLALETQVSRLSKQVAEEATEKRKALKMCDEMTEKVKNMELETMKTLEELNQRNDKIKLLAEEIHELNTMLKGSREDADQQILFERNKVETLEKESHELRQSLEEANDRLRDYVGDSERVSQELREQNSQILQKLKETQDKFECERDEKLTALLKNAEISQSEELLRKELRVERDEGNELHEKYEQLLDELQKREEEVSKSVVVVNELKAVIEGYEEQLKTVEEMQRELNEKSKTIKVLNQRLNDIKKTLQKEFRNAKSFEDVALTAEKTLENGFAPPVVALPLSNASHCCVRSREVNHSGTTVVMDEVNFKYLKHVIVKFLTSRELEARHLIRAVATLLQLSKEEEKLLQDTLNWKMSWFGSKPNHGSGQRAFSIPPS